MADKTYSETIKPRLQGIMEDAQRNADQAMSLQEAGDINNKIQGQVRQSYEQQAQGENRQGIADTGVMQALGAQAFGEADWQRSAYHWWADDGVNGCQPGGCRPGLC